MHHHRQHYAPPRPHRPGVERALSALVATTTGVLLAAALVHWLSCEGMC
jgi:hypothetical protein